MKYRLETTTIDGIPEYSLYKKVQFFFGLFSQYNLVVYTQNFEQVKHYILNDFKK